MGGHTAASWMTAMPMITVPISMVGGAVLGHTVGQTTISQRERERKSEADEKFAAREPIKLPEGPKAAEVESGIQLTGFAEMSVSEAATEQK